MREIGFISPFVFSRRCSKPLLAILVPPVRKLNKNWFWKFDCLNDLPGFSLSEINDASCCVAQYSTFVVSIRHEILSNQPLVHLLPVDKKKVPNIDRGLNF